MSKPKSQHGNKIHPDDPPTEFEKKVAEAIVRIAKNNESFASRVSTERESFESSWSTIIRQRNDEDSTLDYPEQGPISEALRTEIDATHQHLKCDCSLLRTKLIARIWWLHRSAWSPDDGFLGLADLCAYMESEAATMGISDADINQFVDQFKNKPHQDGNCRAFAHTRRIYGDEINREFRHGGLSPRSRRGMPNELIYPAVTVAMFLMAGGCDCPSRLANDGASPREFDHACTRCTRQHWLTQTNLETHLDMLRQGLRWNGSEKVKSPISRPKVSLAQSALEFVDRAFDGRCTLISQPRGFIQSMYGGLCKIGKFRPVLKTYVKPGVDRKKVIVELCEFGKRQVVSQKSQTEDLRFVLICKRCAQVQTSIPNKGKCDCGSTQLSCERYELGQDDVDGLDGQPQEFEANVKFCRECRTIVIDPSHVNCCDQTLNTVKMTFAHGGAIRSEDFADSRTY